MTNATSGDDINLKVNNNVTQLIKRSQVLYK